MADESDELDLNININGNDAAETADEVAKGLAKIRKELKSLNEVLGESQLDPAAARQLRDELLASARQIAADRKKFRDDERAARKQAQDEERASARQISADRKKAIDDERSARKQAQDEQSASARQLSADRKKASDDERAARKQSQDEQRASARQILADRKANVDAARAALKQAQDEQNASARQISADRKKALDDERASRKQSTDEQRASARQISADRKAAVDNARAALKQARDEQLASQRQISADRRKARDEERAAIKQSKDERTAAERQVNFELRKANAERAAYREEDKRNATALAKAEADARRLATQQAREQTAADRARVAASNSVRAGIVALRNEVLQLAAAYVGFRAFANLIQEGIEFNRILETAKLGIGSLIAAQLKMTDSHGRVIEGSEKLAIATALAGDQVAKLRVDSLKTVATTEQLANAFQQASGIGLRFGLTLDQVRKLSVQMAQAAGAVGVPLNQLSEEIRSLMQGTITPRNTRIATLLGITNEDIRNAQQAGKLFDFITGRLEAFSVAGEATAKTFTGVMSNIKEAAQTLAGTVTEPLFDDIRREGQKALLGMFDFDTAQVSEKFSEIITVAQDVFGGVGSLLTDALQAGVEGAQEFNQWLVENKDVVQDIFLGIRYIYEEFVSLSAEVANVLGALVQVGTEMGLIGLTLRTIAVAVAAVHNIFQVLLALLGQIGNIILNLMFRPLILINKLVGAIVGVFNEEWGNAIKKAAGDGEAALDKLTGSVNEYTNALNSGGGALDQFLARVDKSDEVAARSAEAHDNLTTALRIAAQAEKGYTKVLNEELEKKKISQKDYAAAIKKVQLDSLDAQLKAQKQYFASLDQSEDKQRRRTLDTIEDLKKRRDALSKNIKVTPIAGPPEDPHAGADAAGFERAENIRIKQALSERLRDLKIQLDQQLISYRDYYDEVTKAQTKALREQADALDRQAAATKKPGRKAAIQAQAKALRSEIDQITQDNEEKFRAASEKLHDEVETANIQLLKDEGKLAEARAIEVDKKFREKYAQLIRNKDFKGADIMATLFNMDNAKVKLQELQNLVKSSTDVFTAQLQEINLQVENHVITETQGRERLVAAYIRQRDVLAQQLPLMQQLAQASKDANAINEVEALRLKLEEMNLTISRLSDSFYELKEAGRQGLQAGLTDFITSSIMNAKNWRDAWVSAAQAVVGALAQVAAKMLANLILQQTMSAFMSLLGIGSSAAISVASPGAVNAGIAAGVIPFAAGGGVISGPGTTTSDSIPIMVSNKEAVLNANAVRLVGEDFVHELNRLGRYGGPSNPRPGHYASGGVVDARPSQSPSQSKNDKLTIHVRSDDSHIVKVMGSSDGQKVQVDNLRKNKVAANRTLRK